MFVFFWFVTLVITCCTCNNKFAYAVAESSRDQENEKNKAEKSENILDFSATRMESKNKLQVQENDIDHEEIFGDSCTVGSTSKSSSDWRSSITYRDSGTEDPFSSSSRRSCPKWESYTVFQKYDEEMMFLGQLSAQKLHETGNIIIIVLNIFNKSLH